MPSSIYDIREDKITIEGKAWDNEDVQRLVMKNLFITKKMIDYHEPNLQRGEALFKKYEGEILTDQQRAELEDVEGKIVIEPPIMKSPIRALVGHVIKSRKSGTVSCEDGDLDEPNDRAAEIKLVDIAMKDMEKKTKEQLKYRDAIHDAYVSCYPNVILWMKQKPTEDNPYKYKKVHLPWNSCVLGPVNISEPDMSDVTELVYFCKRSQADLELNYPDMVENIRAHWGSKGVDEQMISSVMGWTNAENATYREYLSSILDAANGDRIGPAGMLDVFMRIFQIRRKEEVWVSLADDEDYEVIPEDWDDERKQKWINENQDKYAGPVEHDCITLWITVFTSSGLCLANEKHWFQENGKIPADFVVAAIINGKPSGPALDMDDDTLRNCVAQIEYLDDMRKGGGKLLISVEGAFTDPGAVIEESNKAQGHLTVRESFAKRYQDLNKAFYEISRTPSKNWKEYADFARSDLYDNTRINESMQGQFAPRQAAIAKTTEIEQSLVVNAIYIDNANLQWENTQNLKLAMLSYIFDATRIPIEGYDEAQKEEVSGMLNVPEYDMEGNETGVLNDITSKKYFWKISPVDTSPTAKANMMQEALLILNGAFGPLMQADPSGKIMANFLMALDNSILNKAGKMLAEDAKLKAEQMGNAEKQKAEQDAQIQMIKAQAEMEKAKKAGVTLAFSGKDIAEYPNLFGIYMQLQQVMGQQNQQPQIPPNPQQPPVAAQQQTMEAQNV
jgi:hypothetical protein